MFKKLNGNALATLLGIATTLCTALAVVDLDSLDYSLVSTYFKLAIVLLPALGGYMSTLNKPMK